MNAPGPNRKEAEAQRPALTELLMARLLQTGVLAAAAVVVLGGALYVVHHSGELVAYSRFRPKPLNLRHPLSVLADLRGLGSLGIVVAGILMLVATPICRVVFALVLFAMERDRLYVLVSAVVLGALLFGLLHGA